jgi:transcription elongation GreA/GreB family factor
MQTPKRKPNPYDLIPKDYHMTQEKVESLKKKLQQLEGSLPRLKEVMQAAAEHGDFSENHAYQQAKWKLRGVNGQIQRLKSQIDKALIIKKPIDGSVGLGSSVIVETGGEEYAFTVLGAEETDPDEGIISHLSPLGAALMGRRQGDRVSVEIADTIREYVVKKVS